MGCANGIPNYEPGQLFPISIWVGRLTAKLSSNVKSFTIFLLATLGNSAAVLLYSMINLFRRNAVGVFLPFRSTPPGSPP